MDLPKSIGTHARPKAYRHRLVGRKFHGTTEALNPAWSNVRPDMPRVSETVLRSVGFLYPRREEAQAHSKVGGTCFLIGHQIIVDEIPQPAFVPYMVTARHVVLNAGC